MSLLDILGNYYDSAANNIVKVPNKIKFDLNFEVSKIDGDGLEWSVFGTRGEQKIRINDNYHSNLLQTCNKFEESFYINSLVNQKNHELFNIDIKFPNDVWANKSFEIRGITDGLRYTNIVKDFLHARTSIPKKFSFAYCITRETNETARLQASLNSTDGLSPKEYFFKKLDVSFDSDRVVWSKSSCARAFPRSSIKKSIMGQYYKTSGIFFAEYLYGVKVPKNATFSEFFKRLANRPFSDFGIKDVQVLRKLENLLNRSPSISTAVTELNKLGIVPATDLKRWFRKEPIVKKLFDKSVDLA